jgi:hypothetical protein
MRILINRPAVALATLSALGLAACGSPDSASSRPSITIPVVQNPNTPTTAAPVPVNPPAFPPATTQPTFPAPVTPTTPASTTVTPVVPPTTVTPSVTPTTTVTPPPVVTPPTVPPPATTPDEPDEPVAACSGEGDPAIPQTETGWFPANSNQSCFQGSWYCFDDGVNETTCVTDTPPWDATEMAMCITGTTVERTDPDDYTAWGAGIGASLNDQDGDKEPFDADAAGITGFKFTVSGTLDGATLLFLIPTKTTSEEGPPEFTAKVGANTVSFDDVVQPEWAGTDGPNTEKLYELKWQIKGGDTTSSYSFCISNLEPIYD